MQKANSYSNGSLGFTLIEVLVALSILSLGIAGVSALHHAAYRHIGLTQEVQEATYLADSHLNTLSVGESTSVTYQTGEYSRGLGAQAYPWELSLVPLAQNALQPESASLSSKVIPVTANLTVWVDQGARELRFHSLLLLKSKSDQTSSKPEFKLGAKQ